MKKGFTLIELLVVVAIIGILSAVVLASLGGARSKAKDASIQTQMDQIQVQAELHSSNNGYVYTGLETDAKVIEIVADVTALNTAPTLNVAAGAYAAAAELVTLSNDATPVAQYFCVDSNGSSKVTTTALGTNTVCP